MTRMAVVRGERRRRRRVSWVDGGSIGVVVWGWEQRVMRVWRRLRRKVSRGEG